MAYKEYGRRGPHEHYKGQYGISFYDKTGEDSIAYFDNTREILEWLGRPVTRQNINEMNVHLYKCLKKEPLPRIRFRERKGVMTVWLIPVVDVDDRDEALAKLKQNKYLRWKDEHYNVDWYEIVVLEDTYLLLQKVVPVKYKTGWQFKKLAVKVKCEDINHVFYHLVHTGNYKLFNTYDESLEEDDE